MTKQDLKTFSKYKVIQSWAEKIQLVQGLGWKPDRTKKTVIPYNFRTLKEKLCIYCLCRHNMLPQWTQK